jgi:hypothetical protein
MAIPRYGVPVTGHIDGAYPRVRGRIRYYLNRSSCLKVGITNNYERRARQYSSEYDYLSVLYETRSLNYIREVEIRLIDDYWEYLDNSVRGGGGRRADTEQTPYYCYVAWSE